MAGLTVPSLAWPQLAIGASRPFQQRQTGDVAAFLDVLGRYWPILVGLGAAALAIFDRWRSGRKEIRTQHADLVKIAQDAASGMIGELREELTGLRARLKEAEDEIDRLRARQIEMLEQHTEALLRKDAEIAMLTARCRVLEQDAISTRDLMKRHGIEPPPMPSPIYDVPKGKGTG